MLPQRPCVRLSNILPHSPMGHATRFCGLPACVQVVRSEQLHELTQFMRDVELPRSLARK